MINVNPQIFKKLSDVMKITGGLVVLYAIAFNSKDKKG